MAAPGGGNQGLGAPSDALTALVNTVVDTAQQPPKEPAPDPKVAAAFALGWQMAELYRPDSKKRTAVSRNDLPGLGRLDSTERATISLNQIAAALAKLGPAISAAGLTVPDSKALIAALATPPNYDARAEAVRKFHVELLGTLTATDFRLGKAYGLGRALADTCRNQVSVEALKDEFAHHRIAQLCSWLDDLASVFPAHAAKGVHQSLTRWSTEIQSLDAGPPTGGAGAAAPSDIVHYIDRQGQLWRGLLSGEKSGIDMLVVENYLSAATGMLLTAKKIIWGFIGHFRLASIVTALLFIVGIVLILASKSSASVIAGATALLTSAGLTWKGIGGALGGIAGPIELQLWGAELDTAIADAITLLPANGLEQASRRQLAKDATQGVITAPAPQLLDPVLDPDQLQAKISSLKSARAQHSDALTKLPPEQRLPDDYFDTLHDQIEAEKNEDNPPRVFRAGEASKGITAPAPPRVIYLSRKPAVSQFMSVITTCIESELTGAVTDVSHLDRLWQEVKHWTDELRSRFREFGPCDIRFLEPKLAQLVSGLQGKHAFCVDPPEVRLSETAKVFVLGDWATGLPQARNVAARIAEQLARVEPGVACHVIHLGDTYYSGLEDECRRRFLDLWPVRTISAATSWTLSGNHDMYSGGHGYFDVLLADPRFAAQAGCSYFALANDHWQLLGLDSSYKNPDLADLEPPQSEWLSQRIGAANGRGTIMMTHHQPFSAYEAADPTLAQTVRAALGGHHVEAWLWGHEHRCAVYNKDVVATDYNMDAGYAAVIGHGGVPQLMEGQNTDEVKRAVDWQLADYYQVADDRWGLGGFAVLTFSGPELQVQYYDEYGNERRQGDAVAHQAPADVTQTTTSDSRSVRAPDVLYPGTYAGSAPSDASGTGP